MASQAEVIMQDNYRDKWNGVGDPGVASESIQPDDANDLNEVPKGIYVGTGGDLAMIGVGDPPESAGVIWRNVPAGALIPFRPRRILATGTTAADLIAVQ
ncbi:hypothetical protein D9601_06500 [Sphingomonas sp. MA1305]|uniref:spike base protein, RCAP_Rcc01079 family n=1 Tax=Sphingomonas sp. MA1305 TaxID=2479204 RepID=UPI0018E010AB|nr:hypothetical protein [Sphingomonas sp. MA1305]MBI0475010.1 hypothetical protein [Sphingomonas sp. MA1305]